MGTNSIRANISKEDIISEVRLTLGADIKKEKIILLLEGEDDIKVMAKLVNSNVELIESFSGKEGVKEIIGSYFTDNFRLMGIVDKDYEIIPTSPKIFFYDHCCLEMMILSYKELFESIYYEYYDFVKESSGELREILLRNIRHISILRKYNHKNSLELIFRGMKITNILDENELSVNKLLEEIKKRKTKDIDFENLKSMLTNEISREWDFKQLLDITQGHDFIGIFQYYCKKNKGKEPNKDNIASSLRCVLNMDYFKKTDLFKNLIVYQTNNKLKLIL